MLIEQLSSSNFTITQSLLTQWENITGYGYLHCIFLISLYCSVASLYDNAKPGAWHLPPSQSSQTSISYPVWEDSTIFLMSLYSWRLSGKLSIWHRKARYLPSRLLRVDQLVASLTPTMSFTSYKKLQEDKQNKIARKYK